jgi:hypothetical protein
LASDRLSSSLDFKTSHIGEDFAEIANGLEDMMSGRLDRITESFSEKSLAVVDLMVERSQTLTDAIVETSNQVAESIATRADAIVETSNQLAESIATRADEVNSTLKNSGESLLLGLDLRGSEVAAKLNRHPIRCQDGNRPERRDDDAVRGPRSTSQVVATRATPLRMLQTRLAR